MVSKRQIKDRFRSFVRTFASSWKLFKRSRMGVIGAGIIVFFILMATLTPVASIIDRAINDGENEWIRDPIHWSGPNKDLVMLNRDWDYNARGHVVAEPGFFTEKVRETKTIYVGTTFAGTERADSQVGNLYAIDTGSGKSLVGWELVADNSTALGYRITQPDGGDPGTFADGWVIQGLGNVEVTPLVIPLQRPSVPADNLVYVALEDRIIAIRDQDDQARNERVPRLVGIFPLNASVGQVIGDLHWRDRTTDRTDDVIVFATTNGSIISINVPGKEYGAIPGISLNPLDSNFAAASGGRVFLDLAPDISTFTVDEEITSGLSITSTTYLVGTVSGTIYSFDTVDDNDGDGLVDEDPIGDANGDGCPGTCVNPDDPDDPVNWNFTALLSADYDRDGNTLAGWGDGDGDGVPSADGGVWGDQVIVHRNIPSNGLVDTPAKKDQWGIDLDRVYHIYGTEVLPGARIICPPPGEELNSAVGSGDMIAPPGDVNEGCIIEPYSVVTTQAQGDDIQVIPVGDIVLREETTIILPGPNGILDTVPAPTVIVVAVGVTDTEEVITTNDDLEDLALAIFDDDLDGLDDEDDDFSWNNTITDTPIVTTIGIDESDRRLYITNVNAAGAAYLYTRDLRNGLEVAATALDGSPMTLDRTVDLKTRDFTATITNPEVQPNSHQIFLGIAEGDGSSRQGAAYAFNNDLTPIWKYPTTSGVVSQPLYVKRYSFIYFGTEADVTGKSSIYSVRTPKDIDSGGEGNIVIPEIIWRFDLPGSLDTQPKFADKVGGDAQQELALLPPLYLVTNDERDDGEPVAKVLILSASGDYLAPLPPNWAHLIFPIYDEMYGPASNRSEYYILGTDHEGRDIMSQLLWGSQIALLIGLTATFFSIVIGVGVGLISGYFGRWIDAVMMRFADVILTLPFLPLVIILAAALGPSVWNIVIAITLVGWPGVARTIRAEVLSIRERPYIDAARVTGASHARIMFRHITPNVMPLAFLFSTFSVSGVILTEAGLSFLGLGDPTTMTWGIMLYFITYTGETLTAWWWLWPPGLAITLISLGFFLVGRAWEEILNPRLRKR